MKKQISALLIFMALSFVANAQVYDSPIAGKQSHPELEITKIEITDSKGVDLEPWFHYAACYNFLELLIQCLLSEIR